MAAAQTHYQILGVAASATAAEIEKAYKREIRTWHPDVNQSAEAHARSVLINAAWADLRDPAKRTTYDAGLGRSPTTKRAAASADQPARRTTSASPPTPPPPQTDPIQPAWDDQAFVVGHWYAMENGSFFSVAEVAGDKINVRYRGGGTGTLNAAKRWVEWRRYAWRQGHAFPQEAAQAADAERQRVEAARQAKMREALRRAEENATRRAQAEAEQRAREESIRVAQERADRLERERIAREQREAAARRQRAEAERTERERIEAERVRLEAARLRLDAERREREQREFAVTDALRRHATVVPPSASQPVTAIHANGTLNGASSAPADSPVVREARELVRKYGVDGVVRLLSERDWARITDNRKRGGLLSIFPHEARQEQVGQVLASLNSEGLSFRTAQQGSGATGRTVWWTS